MALLPSSPSCSFIFAKFDPPTIPTYSLWILTEMRVPTSDFFLQLTQCVTHVFLHSLGSWSESTLSVFQSVSFTCRGKVRVPSTSNKTTTLPRSAAMWRLLYKVTELHSTTGNLESIVSEEKVLARVFAPRRVCVLRVEKESTQAGLDFTDPFLVCLKVIHCKKFRSLLPSSRQNQTVENPSCTICHLYFNDRVYISKEISSNTQK